MARAEIYREDGTREENFYFHDPRIEFGTHLATPWRRVAEGAAVCLDGAKTMGTQLREEKLMVDRVEDDILNSEVIQ